MQASMDESFTNHIERLQHYIVFNAAASADSDGVSISEKRKDLLRELENMNQLYKEELGVKFSGPQQEAICDMLNAVHEDRESSSGPFANAQTSYFRMPPLLPNRHIKFDKVTFD